MRRLINIEKKIHCVCAHKVYGFCRWSRLARVSAKSFGDGGKSEPKKKTATGQASNMPINGLHTQIWIHYFIKYAWLVRAEPKKSCKIRSSTWPRKKSAAEEYIYAQSEFDLSGERDRTYAESHLNKVSWTRWLSFFLSSLLNIPWTRRRPFVCCWPAKKIDEEEILLRIRATIGLCASLSSLKSRD